jgi:hypothetical protein
MIKNIPTSKDFDLVAKECLIRAFHMLYQVYDDYNNYDDGPVGDEISLVQIWDFNEGVKKTSLILLHQATESFMKSVICETSPLLLVENPRKEWSSLPTTNKNFDDFYTISGEPLLRTFCATNTKIKIDATFLRFIEEIRIFRNKAAHGASKVNLEIGTLIKRILDGFTLFYGEGAWLDILFKHILKNPLFGYYDTEIEMKISYKFLDFIESYIGIKGLVKYIKKEYINLNELSGRRYLCYECKNAFESEDLPFTSKWAFLVPNLPESTELHCINCDIFIGVIRKDCLNPTCKGNVIHVDHGKDEVCLTCNNYQSRYL